MDFIGSHKFENCTFSMLKEVFILLHYHIEDGLLCKDYVDCFLTEKECIDCANETINFVKDEMSKKPHMFGKKQITTQSKVIVYPSSDIKDSEKMEEIGVPWFQVINKKF